MKAMLLVLTALPLFVGAPASAAVPLNDAQLDAVSGGAIHGLVASQETTVAACGAALCTIPLDQFVAFEDSSSAAQRSRVGGSFPSLLVIDPARQSMVNGQATAICVWC